jgi:hypothetical protein
MAATALVRGVQREIWNEAAHQGPGAQLITTGIRISAAKLACVHGLLTIDAAVGAPVITALPSVGPTGFLVVTVTNLTGGTTADWTLDVQLKQSPSQANRSTDVIGYIQVASGVTGGLAGSQNLAQTYDVGTLAAHQTMTIDDVGHGGGIIIDASTAAATAAAPCLLARQSATVATPVQIARCGEDAGAPTLFFNKARGTFGALADVQVNDAVGSIGFYGYYTGFYRLRATISAEVLGLGGASETGLIFSLSHGGFTEDCWRMDGTSLATNTLRGYGDPRFIPDTNDAGYLGIGDTALWHELNINNGNLRHASNDAVSSSLHFYKARGTYAVPVDVQVDDVLGSVGFYGYYTGFYRLRAAISSEVLGLGGASETGLIFSLSHSGTVEDCWRIDGTSLATNTLRGYGDPSFIPDTNDTGYLGVSNTNLWHELNINNGNLRHATNDAVGSRITFTKARGTYAVPLDVQVADILGTIDFYGYLAGDTQGARITCETTAVAGGLGAAVDIYTKTALGAVTRSLRIDTNATPTHRLILTDSGEIIPDVWPNTSTIGSSTNPWHGGYFTNLALGTAAGVAPAGGATGTLLLTNDSVMPVPQANQVYLGSKDFTGGTNLAVLAISSEEPAVATEAVDATALIPILFNGGDYYLLAISPPA